MILRPALASLAFALASCSGGEPETADSTEASIREALEAEGRGTAALEGEYEEIVWDDLMPDGELERLEALYTDFYDDLEARLKSQNTLSEAAKDQDVAALIAEGSANDSMEQIGTYNVVEDLDGAKVRLPGYVVPFDFSSDAEYSEFLLVPYFGACLHTPPPPPNQMLFVKASPPAKITDIYEPVWLEGTISTGKFESDLGNSAYELTLAKLETYEY